VSDLQADPLGDDLPTADRADSADAETLIRRAHEVVASAKAMPLSASVLISRDEVLALLTAALDRLPADLQHARWLLRERDEFLAERARDADALMEQVRTRAEHMVARTEIIRQANEVAQRIVDEANEDARRMRHEAEDYCDQRLAGMEIVLDRLMRTVRAGREKLQPSPPVEEEQGRADLGVPAEGGAEDGFFDQDRS